MPVERAVLIDIWQRHNGLNNGQIVYGASTAEAGVGIKKSAAAAALRGLVELGFLKFTRNSAFTIKTKEACEYAITAEPVDGQPATRESMKWIGPRPSPKAITRY